MLILPKNYNNKSFYMKKFIRKIYHPNIIFFPVYSINMSNLQQNEIDQIKKDIDLLQDRLKKNEKSQNQFQNGLLHIRRIRVKNGRRMDLSQVKKIQNI